MDFLCRQTDVAFVTLATNDHYALGAMVLAASLRRVGTRAKIVIMTTSDNKISANIK